MASDLQVRWIGVDGSEWNLTDHRSPVQLLGGVGGLHLPEFSQVWSTTANVPGRRRRRVVHEGRDVQLRVMIRDLAGGRLLQGAGWRDIEARWWDSFSEDAEGTLVVETARGRRSIKAYLSEAPDPLYSVDPALMGLARYELTLGSEAHAWSGDELPWEFEFVDGGGEDFFGGAEGGGLGPDFVIGGASQLEDATVENPGDYDAYPRYKLVAPFGSAVIGIGQDLITLPFGADVAQEINIDTDPERLTIVNEAGQNLWPLLDSAAEPLFAPVPRKSSVELTIQMDAALAGAKAMVWLTPLYRRALS